MVTAETDKAWYAKRQGNEIPAEQDTEPEEEEVYVAPLGECVKRDQYTIVDRAGKGNVEKQVSLATWHMRKLAEVERRRAVLLAPLQEEIVRLQSRAAMIGAKLEAQGSFHESALELWGAEEAVRAALGNTIPLAYGTVRTRQSRGKTEVDNAVVLTLYQDNPAEYGDLIKPAVVALAVRERFTLREDGVTVDTTTGEVLQVEVIRVTEELTIKVSVEVDLNALVPQDAKE